MESLRKKLNWIWVLTALGVGAILFSKAPVSSTSSPPPDNREICKHHIIQDIPEGLVIQAEDGWSRVLVSDRWDQVPIDEQSELGYFIALCRSANEKTEILRASDQSLLGRYEIDLHYRMTHGLPVRP